MKFFAALSLIFHCFIIETTEAKSDCDPILNCVDFRFESTPAQFFYEYEVESDVASQGHWEGIVPEYYKIYLNFQNEMHYTGSVDIKFKVVQATKRIAINQNESSPIIDYKSIEIKPLCDKAPKQQNYISTSRCIKSALFLEKASVLILDLSEKLEAGGEHTLSIPSFEGSATIIGNENATRKGFFYTKNETESFSASVTLFEMRLARTVFPCFDHPALKAKFELCADGPADILIASNTPQVPTESKSVGWNRKHVCFEPTPVMSTYLFAFALMKNYSMESLQVPNGTLLEVFAPTSQIANISWILEASISAIRYMERVTNFKYPLKRLTFLIHPVMNGGGMENFGFIMLGTETSYEVIYHEIIHHWIGNVMTINEWREICLQEGLTSYFAWKAVNDLRNQSLYSRTFFARGRIEEYHEPEIRESKYILGSCYNRAAFYFYTMAVWDSFETLEQFLTKLIEKTKYRSANFDMWDATMNEVMKRNKDQVKGYIKGWFLQPGPVYLITSQTPKSNCIKIQQKVYSKSGSLLNISRPVPLEVQTFGGSNKTISLVLNKLEETICDTEGSFFLVDSGMYTYTMKVYPADHYRRILMEQHQNSSMTSELQLKNFIWDFCNVLANDHLPLIKDAQSRDWLEVYVLILTANATVGESCKCCLHQKTIGEDCEECKKLKENDSREWFKFMNDRLGFDFV